MLYDNIVAGRVPEPGSLVLMMLGGACACAGQPVSAAVEFASVSKLPLLIWRSETVWLFRGPVRHRTGLVLRETLHSMYSSSQRRKYAKVARNALLIGVAVFWVRPSESRAADLLVVDRLSNSVYRYSAAGALLGTVVDHSADLNQPTGIGMSPDFKELFVSSSQNNRVMKYDYDAATGVATNPTIFADATGGLAFPNDIQFSPDGSKVYVANLDGGVSQFNAGRR